MNETGVGADVFFVLVGAILVFAMHGGFVTVGGGNVAGTTAFLSFAQAFLSLISSAMSSASVRESEGE